MNAFKVLSVYVLVLLLSLTNSSEWSYSNITAWNQLSGSYCSGTYDATIYPQSPINIDTASVISGSCALNWQWKTSTDASSITYDYKLSNSGHSLIALPINANGELVTNNSHSIAQLYTTKTSAEGTDEKFCLNHFHFHWGISNTVGGSEHTINSKRYAVEAHFVHFNCKYATIVDAAAAGEALLKSGNSNPYTLAVVGVLYEFNSTAVSPGFDAIFNAISSSLIKGNSTNVNNLVITDFLPSQYTFYSYKGSLTTPLCQPIVRWYVLRNMLQVSESNMNSFRNSVLNENLFRPVQSLISDAHVSECDIVGNGSQGIKNAILLPVIFSLVIVMAYIFI